MGSAPVARRVWAVAAVDAQARRLVRLHDRISERFQEGDQLVYLGNYIGYGKAVLATIGRASRFPPSSSGTPGWFRLRCSFPARHTRRDVAEIAAAALRHAAFTDERGLLFVHASIDPSRPLTAQGDAFWWGVNTSSISPPRLKGSDASSGELTATGAASSNTGSLYPSMGAPGTAAR